MTATKKAPKKASKQPTIAALKKRTALWWDEHQIWVILSTLILLLLLLFLYDRIFISIHSGEKGVLWRRFNGTEIHKIYDEGFHIISPLDIMYIYDVREQIIHDEVVLLSKDGLDIRLHFSARFFPNLDQLNQPGNPMSLALLHKRLGPQYVTTVVHPEVVAAFRSVIGNYTPEQIYAEDEEDLLGEIMETARVQLEGGTLIRPGRAGSRNRIAVEGKFIVLQDVLIHELSLPEKVKQAISDKVTQKHRFLAYEYILQAEEQEVIRRSTEAMGIRMFEQISEIPILQWRGIEATKELATSDNAKFIVIGNDSQSLPVILNMGDGETTGTTTNTNAAGSGTQ